MKLQLLLCVAFLAHASAHVAKFRGQKVAVNDPTPVSTEPKHWPKGSGDSTNLPNGDAGAPVAQEEAAPPPSKPKPVDQSSPDQLKKADSPLWHLLVTWLVLILVTVAYRQMVHGKKSYTPAQRAPYMAFLIILWFITVFATIFFTLSTHAWTWIECMYFCVVTVTTVGYGDYVPHDSVLDRLMLLAFLWLNMMVLSVVLGIVTGAVDEGAEGKKGQGLKWHVLNVFGLTILGAFLFMYLEGKTFLQGFTWATVTLTTVGYGALLPTGPAAMICASIFILIGVPMTGCLVGELSGLIDDKFKNKKAAMSKRALTLTYVGIIIGWLFLGAVLFHTFNGHGWDLPQCLYLAAVTMTTVGYGDYTPEKTFADHIVTIVYIWGSVIIIAAVFGDLDGLLLDAITAGKSRMQSLITRLMILATIIVTGVVAFDYFEGWPILHGLVYTSVTCTTVGYGHLLPTSAAARLFAVPFLLAGVPMTGCLVSSISGQYSDEITKLIED